MASFKKEIFEEKPHLFICVTKQMNVYYYMHRAPLEGGGGGRLGNHCTGRVINQTPVI